jgi:deoxyribose-phosphate aldolase
MSAIERTAARPASLRQLMAYIDHTMVRAELTRDEIAGGIRTAVELGAANVVVRPWEVRWARDRVPAGSTHLGTSISFPHGDEPTRVKVLAAATAVEDGADEIDVVMNVAAFCSGELGLVADELRQIVECARPAIVKVILETAYLDRAQVVAAARLVADAGADFVKNGTGYSPRGATAAETALIRASVPAGVGVKAAGGIRSLDAALALIDAGATRIGTSATSALAAEWHARSGSDGGS